MRTGRNRVARAVAAVAALAVSAALLAGCSTSIKIDGLDVAEADKATTAALDKLKTDNQTTLENGSATVSDKTKCFYVHTGKDSDDVQRELACGPIRRLGVPDSKVWDRYGLTLDQDSKGKVTAAVGSLSKVGTSVDTSLLVSPSGDDPAKASEVPAPTAPKTDVINKALVLDSAAGMDISFTAVDKPWRVNTPAATIDITATAQPQYVPLELVSGGMGGDPGSAKYYRPADGQRMYAYKIKISPSAETGVSYGNEYYEDPVDMISQLTLDIGDGRMINIQDRTDPESDQSDYGSDDPDNKTWSIHCLNGEGYGAANFPCKLGASYQAVLLATAPATAAPRLSVSVNGDAQTLDLGSGTLTSALSRVEYQRSALTTKIGKQLKVGPYTEVNKGFGSETRYAATWSQTIESMNLSAFDPGKGWAPEGQAWLTVVTKDGIDYSGDYFAFDTDETTSASLKIGDKSYKPVNDSVQYVWLFQVPDTTTRATFDFQPHGTYTGDQNDRAFSVPGTGSVSADLPK